MPVTTITGPNSVQLVQIPEDTKVDLRRLMGYSAYGFGITGFYQLGLYNRVYQLMEFRLNTLTESEYSRITSLYLPNLYQLETDLLNLRNLAMVDKAAVFTRNPKEAQERHNEFSWWRMELCNFLGLQPGPNFSGRRGNSVNLIPC